MGHKSLHCDKVGSDEAARVPSSKSPKKLFGRTELTCDNVQNVSLKKNQNQLVLRGHTRAHVHGLHVRSTQSQCPVSETKFLLIVGSRTWFIPRKGSFVPAEFAQIRAAIKKTHSGEDSKDPQSKCTSHSNAIFSHTCCSIAAEV